MLETASHFTLCTSHSARARDELHALCFILTSYLRVRDELCDCKEGRVGELVTTQVEAAQLLADAGRNQRAELEHLSIKYKV